MDEDTRLVKTLRSLAQGWRDRAWTTQNAERRDVLRTAARELEDELTREMGQQVREYRG